jgi:hypothetical protein
VLFEDLNIDIAVWQHPGWRSTSKAERSLGSRDKRGHDDSVKPIALWVPIIKKRGVAAAFFLIQYQSGDQA